ncbi:fructokinase [Pedobacter sp. CAN_A7]|uniref:carbohydrate kinase family protein n=1 Tax=Pedobacter sp. CAN_A7 TaxID=2787722 RepID=UPI0018C97B2B
MKSKKSVVCFGEILWDNLPTGKKPGGAPMNVAYHLHKLGIDSQLISSIGDEQSGVELMGFLKEIGLKTDLVQIDRAHDTSEVQASVNPDNHEVTYEIISPVAWDFISWQPNFETLLKEAQAFVFGTLSTRNPATRNTLYQMLEHSAYRVFDVNLRAPHYSPEVIEALLKKSNLVKLNSSELLLIAQWYNQACVKEADCVEVLFDRFNIEEVIITKGSQGATYYTSLFRYDYPAYSVHVADTIGSGDSFLAAFLAMKLGDEPVEITLDYAVAMGAFITSQAGACPQYSKFDLERFIWKKKLGIYDKT